ncbi:F-box only protein 15-like [Saccoglossus kowalevskii]
MASPSSSSRHTQHLKSYLQSHKSASKNISYNDKKLLTSPSKGVNRSLVEKSPSTKPSGGAGLSTKPKTYNASSPVRVIRKLPVTASHFRRKVNIESLPSEIILKIFTYLGPNDLLICASVCKQWLKLANDNSLWRKLYEAYIVTGKKKKTETQSVTKASGGGDHHIIQWKRDCIRKCVNIRNGRIQALLKKLSPYTGLPVNTQQALEKLGIKWQLVVTDTSGSEHVIAHNDRFCFPLSTTVRWYSLESLPLKRIKRLSIYGLAPVFYGNNGNALTNSPCQRSLLLHQPINSSSQNAPDGQDGTVNIYILTYGLMLATWQDGGELAFVSLSIGNHQLVQRCSMATSDSVYIPSLRKPPVDDVDSQCGLHSYSCTIELRNQRAVYWGQQFQQLHCHKQDLVGRYARLVPIRSDVTYDHSYTNKKIHLPWKTDVFKGIVQDMCILDVILLDEHKNPMWSISNPVKLKRSTEAQVSSSCLWHVDSKYGNIHVP